VPRRALLPLNRWWPRLRSAWLQVSDAVVISSVVIDSGTEIESDILTALHDGSSMYAGHSSSVFEGILHIILRH